MKEERRDGCLLRVARQMRDLWVMAAITLVAILLLDAVLRNVLPGGTSEPAIDPAVDRPSKRAADVFEGIDWQRDYFREHDESGPTRWEPYSYWRRKPFSGSYINIDDEGRRHTWNPERESGAPIVWTFGGSTMWGMGARDGHTIASELSRQLAERNLAAHVVNFAESGYVSTQELMTLLRELQRGRRPDLVIFYDGVNDVYAAVLENEAGIPMNERNRRREFNLTREWSGLARAAVWRLEGLQRLAAMLRGRPAPERPESLAKDVLEAYEINVRAVQSLATAYGFEALFVWQPSVFTKKNVTDFERRMRDSRLQVHRDLQLETNRLIRASALVRDGTPFVDLSTELDEADEPLYVDFCHLSEEGNRRIARAMLPFVEAALSGPSDQAGK